MRKREDLGDQQISLCRSPRGGPEACAGGPLSYSSENHINSINFVKFQTTDPVYNLWYHPSNSLNTTNIKPLSSLNLPISYGQKGSF
jgi:hypothetical protein